MKRAVCLLMALLMALGSMPALAEEKIIPEDKAETVTEFRDGYACHFRNYSSKFWEAPSGQPGTIERVDYTTSVYGEKMDRWTNVYLPYGYDAEKQYNIFYFFHGSDENQESFICDERVKNAVDNMIEHGICKPFIMVCPTYYFDKNDARTLNPNKFVDELRDDLMPAVESKYSSFAPTAHEDGFIASRAHRAFSGYSQGCSVCLAVLWRCMDYAKWFAPMSGVKPDQFKSFKDAVTKSPYGSDMFFYFCSGGKRDVAYDGVVSFVNAMIKDGTFSYGTDPAVNNYCACISKEIHQTMKARFNLYNIFQDGLFQ